MAKGNDGNYLQHSVEVALALHLASLQPEGRLHIALTHGMKPFERCDWEGTGQARNKLRKALEAAHATALPGETGVVTAYRSCGARLGHYPNTAELLRAALGTESLSGGITESDEDKYLALHRAWHGTTVEVRHSSWRSEVLPEGVIACPPTLDTPWLFSMDPYTYKEAGLADDANLYRADLDRLSDVLEGFVRSGQPGAATLFVYNVHAHKYDEFWMFLDELALRTDAIPISCWLTHRWGNRNLAGLLCSGFDFPDSLMPPGVSAGRG